MENSHEGNKRLKYDTINYRKTLPKDIAIIELQALTKAQAHPATVVLKEAIEENDQTTIVMENLAFSYTPLKEILPLIGIDEKILIISKLFDYVDFLSGAGLSMDDGNINNIFYNRETGSVKFIDFSQYARNEFNNFPHFTPYEQLVRWLKNIGFGSYADEMSKTSDVSILKSEVMGFLQRDIAKWHLIDPSGHSVDK